MSSDPFAFEDNYAHVDVVPAGAGVERVFIDTTWTHIQTVVDRARAAGAENLSIYEPDPLPFDNAARVFYFRKPRPEREPGLSMDVTVEEIAALVAGGPAPSDITNEIRRLHKDAMKLGGSHAGRFGLVVSAFGKGTNVHLKVGKVFDA